MTPSDDLVVRFTDASGVEWTVWEDLGLRQPVVGPTTPRPSRDPNEWAGALMFDSREGVRRISVAPPGWWDLPPAELARLCACAEPVE